MARRRTILHGLNAGQGEEFSLCGMSYDAFESGDADETIVFAEPGQKINCPDCLEFLTKTYERFSPTGRVRN